MSGPLVLAAAAGAGYLAGSVSPATWLARRRGVDLRAVGSGNPGATNAGRAFGRRAGVVVALLDLAKGLAAALGLGQLGHEAGLVAGLAAVVGHVTSPWLRGRGGKGVATAAGAVAGSQPWFLVPVLVTWVALVAAGRRVAVASVAAAVALAGVAVATRRDVWWAVSLAAVIVVRHRGNFRRPVGP